MLPHASLAHINVDYSCFSASSDTWLRVSANKYACTDAATVSSVCDQVITSRNIRGGWLTDFRLGGLNYQIKHHLFPSMPRPSLHLARQPVRAFCHKHETAYRGGMTQSCGCGT
jgi:fatty acid desaturase